MSKFKYVLPAATQGRLFAEFDVVHGKPELTKKACPFCHVDHTGPVERALCKRFN
jgi:hypothetical protein